MKGRKLLDNLNSHSSANDWTEMNIGSSKPTHLPTDRRDTTARAISDSFSLSHSLTLSLSPTRMSEN